MTLVAHSIRKSYLGKKTTPTMALTNSVSCGLVNIQSVGNKTVELYDLIIENKYDICMLTETWLSDNISDSAKIAEMTPRTHTFYHVPRTGSTGHGGGVGIFLGKMFSNTKLKSSEKFGSFEYMVVTTRLGGVHMQLVVVYRPPSLSKRLFLDEFGTFLDSLVNLNNTVICGDFNLWYENTSDNYVSEFIELLTSHDLMNSVTTPTALSGHILDLVIHKVDPKIVQNCLVENECLISPFHKQVTFGLKIDGPSPVMKTIRYRNKTNFEPENFIKECIVSMNEQDTDCECLVNENYQCVSCYTVNKKNIMAAIYDIHCPVIEKCIRIRVASKWFNDELRKAKREKRRLQQKWKRKKNETNKQLYVGARNRYNALVRKTKKIYYINLFKESKDSKTKHKNLEELLGLKGEVVFPDYTQDNRLLAQSFADFYIRKVDRFVASMPMNNPDTIQIEENTNTRKFRKFRILSLLEFRALINRVNCTYCDCDPLPVKDVKTARNFSQIEDIYFKITNMSLSQALFPK